MRLASKLLFPYPWALLFLFLCDLCCQASFSGPELRQSHDEGQQPGEGAQDGVNKDPLHGLSDQDGVDGLTLHGKMNPGPRFTALEGDIKMNPGSRFTAFEGDIKLNPGSRFTALVGDIKLNPGSRFTALEGDIKLNPGGFTAPEGNINVHSSRVDFPCPEAADIEPCLCTVDAEQNIDLDCTNVNSEEQLAAVFQQEFPVKTLRFFNMTENSNIKVFDNILNEVTFQNIYLYPGPFALSTISDYFFLSCRESLVSIRIVNTNLTSAAFPFAAFAVMENLNNVEVRGSSFTWIPKITAPALSALRFTYGKTEVLQSETFPIHEGGILIYLYDNLIHTIEPGSFYFSDENSLGSNEQVIIGIHVNKLRFLQAGTFPIRNGPTHIYLYDNQIEAIEPGTFMLPGDTTQLSLSLDLNNNQLTAFAEEVFGELMPYAYQIYLYGNPLACDCALAWIITNPEYLAKIHPDTACEDGTLIHDLNPDDYVNFC